MNEVAVLDNVKNLITDNRDILVQGLVHQGVARSLDQIVTSNLTPPYTYYYILIYITQASEESKPRSATSTRRPTRQAVYQVQIEIADNALVQEEDEEPYDTMHNDFRILCDRIIDLIESQNWIGQNPKLKLLRPAGNDRLIEKFNLSGTWTDTENNEQASLYCQIRFALIDECVDTGRLY